MRRDPTELFKPEDSELRRIKNKYVPEWSMLDYTVLECAWEFVDAQTAMRFAYEMYRLGEDMDHNAVVKIDHNSVEVQIRTGDVDGLTILDFEFALRATDIAEQLEGDRLSKVKNELGEAYQGGLRKWFKEKWVNIAKKKKGGGYEECGSSGDKKGYAKCVPAAKAAGMSSSEKKSAVQRKRSAQRKAGRPGKKSGAKGKAPIRVSTKK